MDSTATRRKPQLASAADHERGQSAPSPAKKNDQPIARTISRLLRNEDLPSWYQDPLIRGGYRPVSNSVRACLTSMFTLHNETLNILTHLIPALFIMAIFAEVQRLMQIYFPEASSIDRTIFNINLIAALTTALLSSVYHTFLNHSQFISSLTLKIDYFGIVLLMQASFISGVYVGFYRHPSIQKFYWGMITLLSTLTCTLTIHPRLQGLAWRPVRTAIFILTGLSGLAPALHGFVAYGFDEALIYSGVQYWLSEGLAYATGAFFFATRIPESLSPKGTFDIFGSSHQIFHVCVVVGAVIHLYGVWETWRANLEYMQPQTSLFGDGGAGRLGFETAF